MFIQNVAVSAVSVPMFLIGSASGAIIYVDDSATGANNGTSWENAYVDLHDGLNSAQPSDEVRVGQGTYKPAPPQGDRTLSFSLPDGVIVHGGYTGFGAPDPDANDPQQFITILSGDLNGDDGTPGDFQNRADNSYSVVSALGVNLQTQLRGFTIQGGSADDYDGCMPPDDYTRGGGIVVIDSQLLIADVTFMANQAACTGGAISSDGQSSIAIENCRFTMNRNQIDGGFGAGGAIGVWNGQLTVRNSLFQNNGGATIAGGALWALVPTAVHACRFETNISDDGGGALAGSHFHVSRCQFVNNGARTWGGAVHANDSTFVNCTFLGNTCGTSSGGAIKTHGGGIALVNCLVAGNNNSALAFEGTSAANALVNCTVVGNSAVTFPLGGPGGLASSSQVTLVNNIFWDNQSETDDAQAAQLAITASSKLANNIIEGWDGSLGGENNSGEDPQFIDADGADNQYGTDDDDPRLGDNSPAIDAGDNAALPADDFDIDEDGDTAEPLPLDLGGEARIVNEVVDRGAYEFQDEVPVCEADIAPEGGDGEVNVDDLLLVINNWGASGENPGDVTGNGTVDVDDLLAVINGWGACP